MIKEFCLLLYRATVLYNLLHDIFLFYIRLSYLINNLGSIFKVNLAFTVFQYITDEVLNNWTNSIFIPVFFSVFRVIYIMSCLSLLITTSCRQRGDNNVHSVFIFSFFLSVFLCFTLLEKYKELRKKHV